MSAVGCEHYQRRCKLVAPCCNEEFWCRFCHDACKYEEEQDVKVAHQMDRTKVVELVCQQCGTRQPKSERCRQCNIRFGLYTCLRCSLFDDDTSKSQFHCDGCGICRQGGRQNFFHCDGCGCCLSIALRTRHRCRKGGLKVECPVCLQNLFSSTQFNVRFEDCGHFIHQECLNNLVQNWNSYLCPLCLRSQRPGALKAWETMEDVIARTPLPKSHPVNILCRDCCVCSTGDYHPIGVKCSSCRGFNTCQI